MRNFLTYTTSDCIAELWMVYFDKGKNVGEMSRGFRLGILQLDISYLIRIDRNSNIGSSEL